MFTANPSLWKYDFFPLAVYAFLKAWCELQIILDHNLYVNSARIGAGLTRQPDQAPTVAAIASACYKSQKEGPLQPKNLSISIPPQTLLSRSHSRKSGRNMPESSRLETIMEPQTDGLQTLQAIVSQHKKCMQEQRDQDGQNPEQSVSKEKGVMGSEPESTQSFANSRQQGVEKDVSGDGKATACVPDNTIARIADRSFSGAAKPLAATSQESSHAEIHVTAHNAYFYNAPQRAFQANNQQACTEQPQHALSTAHPYSARSSDIRGSTGNSESSKTTMETSSRDCGIARSRRLCQPPDMAAPVIQRMPRWVREESLYRRQRYEAAKASLLALLDRPCQPSGEAYLEITLKAGHRSCPFAALMRHTCLPGPSS